MDQWSQRLIIGLIGTGLCGISWAGTVIERRNIQGQLEKLIIEKHQARIEMSDPNYYTLIDLKKNKVYQINANKKQVVAMAIIGYPPERPQNRSLPPRRSAGPIEADLVKKGAGPKIAGYPTIVYQVTANNRLCSENYFSEVAANKLNIKAFLKALHQMVASRKPAGLPVHPCQQAHDDLKSKIMALGISMKSVIKSQRDEKVRYEITNIQENAHINTQLFTWPKDYQIITEREMIRERQAEMRKWMEKSRQQKHYEDRRPPSYRRDEDREEDYYRSPRNWRESRE